MENLFEYTKPSPQEEELASQLFGCKNVRIERIVSTGQESGWYDQDEDEWVCLLRGSAALEYADGEEVSLQAGDMVFLPAHKRHRVARTSRDPECLWLCVFVK